MFENFSIPHHLSRALQNIQNAREKAAENKLLLDTGENLVMYLAAFVLGEYRNHGLEEIKLEKSFYANRTNLSFGVYLGFLREGMKAIQKEKKEGLLENFLMKNNVYNKISYFIHSFNVLKNFVNSGGTQGFEEELNKNQKQSYGKTNVLEFFNTFIELRNRTAHPHKEITDKQTGAIKTVTWPFSVDYFDYINPKVKAALDEVIETLSPVWNYVNHEIVEKDETKYKVKSLEDDRIAELELEKDYPVGATILLDKENKFFICNDLRTLMQVSQNVLDIIEAEEAEKRKVADLEGFKENIKMALDDGQISLEEFRTFQTIAKNKFQMNDVQLKEFIIKIAKEMDIDDPFPETDKRYVTTIDNALITKDFNRLILKLQGEQYGVMGGDFDKLLKKRAEELNVDLEDVEKNAKVVLSPEDLKDVSTLMEAFVWIRDLSMLNRKLKTGSLYDVVPGDNRVPGTINYKHYTLFNKFNEVISKRISKLSENSKLKWEVISNRWQAGKMTGYCWQMITPKIQGLGKAITIAVKLTQNDIEVWLESKWDDLASYKYYPLLIKLFKQNILLYLTEYESEFKKYSDFRLGHTWWPIPPFLKDFFDNLEEYLKFVATGAFLFGFKTFGNQDIAMDNPYKHFEELSIVFSLLDPMITKIIEDLDYQKETFINPIDNNASLVNTSIDNFNEYFSKYTKINAKKYRNKNYEFYYDYQEQTINSISIKLEYGFMLDMHSDNLIYTIRFKVADDSKDTIYHKLIETYKNTNKNNPNIVKFLGNFVSINKIINVDEEHKINPDELAVATEELKTEFNLFIDLACSMGVNVMGYKFDEESYKARNAENINLVNNLMKEIIKSKIQIDDIEESENSFAKDGNKIEFGIFFDGYLNRPYWMFKVETNNQNNQLVNALKFFADDNEDFADFTGKTGTLTCKVPFVNPNQFDGEDFEKVKNDFTSLYEEFTGHIGNSGQDLFGYKASLEFISKYKQESDQMIDQLNEKIGKFIGYKAKYHRRITKHKVYGDFSSTNKNVGYQELWYGFIIRDNQTYGGFRANFGDEARGKKIGNAFKNLSERNPEKYRLEDSGKVLLALYPINFEEGTSYDFDNLANEIMLMVGELREEIIENEVYFLDFAPEIEFVNNNKKDLEKLLNKLDEKIKEVTTLDITKHRTLTEGRMFVDHIADNVDNPKVSIDFGLYFDKSNKVKFGLISNIADDLKEEYYSLKSIKVNHKLYQYDKKKTSFMILTEIKDPSELLTEKSDEYINQIVDALKLVKEEMINKDFNFLDFNFTAVNEEEITEEPSEMDDNKEVSENLE